MVKRNTTHENLLFNHTRNFHKTIDMIKTIHFDVQF